MAKLMPTETVPAEIGGGGIKVKNNCKKEGTLGVPPNYFKY